MKKNRKKSLVGWTYDKPYLHWDSQNNQFFKYAIISPMWKVKGDHQHKKIRITIEELK